MEKKNLDDAGGRSNAGLEGPLFHGTSKQSRSRNLNTAKTRSSATRTRNLFATSDALDSPVEERRFEGRVPRPQ